MTLISKRIEPWLEIATKALSNPWTPQLQFPLFGLLPQVGRIALHVPKWYSTEYGAES